MRCRGRADAPRPVGAWRCDGQLHFGKERARHGMGRRTKGDGVETCGDQVDDRATRTFPEHQRQGPWPEGFCKLARGSVEKSVGFSLDEPEHMHDQRIEAWPLFGGEDLGDCGAVERVGAEPIDRLGGKRDDVAAGDRAGGLSDGLWRSGDDGHGGPHFACYHTPVKLPRRGRLAYLSRP